MARLCLALCSDEAALVAWGEAHAGLIATFDSETQTEIRAAYVETRTGLRTKETDR